MTAAVPQLGSPLRLIVPCSLPGSGNINGPWSGGVTPVPLFGSAHCFVWASIYLDVNQLSKSVTSCPCVAGGRLGLVCWRKSALWRLELCADCVSIISPVTDGSDIMRPHPSSLCSGKRTRVYYSARWEHCSRRFSTILEN